MFPAGIVSALTAEAACLTGNRRIDPGRIVQYGQHMLLVSGMGPERAKAAAQSLVSSGARGLVSWGTAGALEGTLQPGALILPETLISSRGEQITVDRNWQNNLRNQLSDSMEVHHGKLLETCEVIPSPEEKARIFTDTSAIAVDMESAAVATVARDADLPMVVVRSIVDSQSMQLPQCALQGVDEYGRVKILQLIFSLLRNPSQCSSLPGTAVGFQRALATLEKVKQQLGSDLGFSNPELP